MATTTHLSLLPSVTESIPQEPGATGSPPPEPRTAEGCRHSSPMDIDCLLPCARSGNHGLLPLVAPTATIRRGNPFASRPATEDHVARGTSRRDAVANGAARSRQRGTDSGSHARRLGLAMAGASRPGCALRDPCLHAESRVCGRRHRVPGAGHRGEHRTLPGRGCRSGCARCRWRIPAASSTFTSSTWPARAAASRRGTRRSPIPSGARSKARQQAFSGVFVWGMDRFNLATGGEIRPATGLWVSGEFFDVLGVQPLVGRPLGPADDRPGCPARGSPELRVLAADITAAIPARSDGR